MTNLAFGLELTGCFESCRAISTYSNSGQFELVQVGRYLDVVAGFLGPDCRCGFAAMSHGGMLTNATREERRRFAACLSTLSVEDSRPEQVEKLSEHSADFVLPDVDLFDESISSTALVTWFIWETNDLSASRLHLT